MENEINILVIAKLSDAKLTSKLLSLVSVRSVKDVYLVRRTPLIVPKVKSYYPPKFLRQALLVEIYRIIAIFCLLLTKKIDLVIGFHFIPHGIYAGLFALLFGKKYIILFTENPQLLKNNILYRMLIKRAFRIGVRGTKSFEVVVGGGTDPENVFIQHNIFNLNSTNIQRIIYKEFDVIFIGNFVMDKRPDIFVNTVLNLKMKLPNIKAIMLGEGPLKQQIKDMIVGHSLVENVIVAGWKKEVFDYINKSRVFLLTSETEGLPSALIESFSLGVPGVVSGVGDITDLAIDNVNSLVIHSLNPYDFSTACYKLLTEKDLYDTLSKNALKTIRDKSREYSLKSSQSTWEKILEKL